ncbi:hypothetical protein PRK78_003863 [Emydomyces testavorans]|uniref:Uncharacterized protein n=1 Tax=Emydomyces testavorans TaxID=2070801 RepID=A0AAF0DH06_9EURO|nr:hypothetical protein PRK78_003863 [Emydomyces testavorans]
MAQSPEELFATSWTLHRLSPLYHSKESKGTILDNPDALSIFADRLRDMLTGDMLHGIQLSLDNTSLLDEVLVKAGALKSCTWRTMPTWNYWNEEHSLLADPEQESLTVTAEQSAGILVTLEYETIRYKAALLGGPDGYHDARDDEVTYLPLLVTRMPNALRQAFISFLGTNFDARCSILRLPSAFLGSCLETYLATLHQSVRGDNNVREVIERVMKEVQVTVSFVSPVTPTLKSMDISLPRQSLSAFYVRGLENEGLSPNPANRTRKGKLGSSSAAVFDNESPTPFLSALSDYFKAHLAMSLDVGISHTPNNNPRNPEKQYMRLTKIACGAFVIGFEGRMKLLANPGRTIFLDESQLDELGGDDGLEDAEDREKRFIWRANEELLRKLVARAMGNWGHAEGPNISTIFVGIGLISPLAGVLLALKRTSCTISPRSFFGHCERVHILLIFAAAAESTASVSRFAPRFPAKGVLNFNYYANRFRTRLLFETNSALLFKGFNTYDVLDEVGRTETNECQHKELKIAENRVARLATVGVTGLE